MTICLTCMNQEQDCTCEYNSCIYARKPCACCGNNHDFYQYTIERKQGNVIGRKYVPNLCKSCTEGDYRSAKKASKKPVPPKGYVQGFSDGKNHENNRILAIIEAECLSRQYTSISQNRGVQASVIEWQMLVNIIESGLLKLS